MADHKDEMPETERPPASQGGGLKVVTLAPGLVSHPDIEEILVSESGQTITAARDPYLGATVDNRYKLEKVLGEGGMGVVYRATHTIIGKKVAVKVLRADMARDQEATERFLNEARAASAIGNPHIVDISDFGRFPDGSTYFVMEYLDGVALSELVGEGTPVPVRRIIHIARQLGEGLAAAHEAGIVHRDLKPDNILLVRRGSEQDFVKILDFGIAKVTSEAGKLTRAGAVFGTPHYMSPEQAAGAPVDHRGDIYSLGVILYEMASGRVPFDADNFMGILTQHMYKAPVPIRALVPEPQGVPPGLEAIVMKCLSKRPEQRYSTMQELVADLEKVVEGAVPAAVPEMMVRSGGFNVPADYFKKSAVALPAAPPAQPRSRWPLVTGLVGVSVAIASVIAIFIAGRESPAAEALPSVPSGVVAALSAPAAHSSTAAPTPSAAPSASAPRRIVIAVQPLEAVLYDGDRALGQSPVIVELPEEGELMLLAKAPGYADRNLVVDGTSDRITIKLERERAAVPQRPPAAKGGGRPGPEGSAGKKTRVGGGEIVDPWGGG